MADPQIKFLKPVEGRIVRDPATMQILDANGQNKPLNKYWRKRIKKKDVFVIELEKEITTKAKNKITKGDK